MTTTSPTRSPGIDDYLGPGAHRFFGAGYKRAEQRLTDIAVTAGPDGAGTVEASAAVSYPADWSRKGSVDQLPHLSSIDVLLIAAETAEVHLTRARGLTPADRAALRLRRVRLLAGSSPVEEELAGFAVRARIAAPTPVPGAGDLMVSVVDCQVGKLRARAEVLHPAGTPAAVIARYADADAALGPARRRPYAAAHRDKTQHVEDVALDLPARAATARLGVTWTTPDELELTGLDSAAHRGVSVIDAFVAAIQLGQVLLYELDGVRRADSHTLWMRQTTLETADPGRPATGSGVLRARLADAQLLTAGDGAQWRSARIEADYDHLSIACAVAHQLPGLQERTTT
ncbi:hypothetical protein Daura_28310 [Dactylosporangium aurantiacum]|uniref:Avirulence D protein (AvrD) n=1 Tax=Dactylosporangium aurantiacum TaxID=35754 RepID=A0A9Q9I982_9ACTN|nr:AvrD family protein [Dactylosporangium aurantiacum]MDG6106916.1 AvrD family protein [Dactylosporangium aurantiacum]UWZ50721.1 hypothetical protein Daura_28310 [Dactylosporangium aurantiacum]